MKDFFKIFAVLCICVGSFMYGRNYGESNYKESLEYKNLIKTQEDLNFTKSELENLKAKFQNIADSSENKKQEELLGQILQVLLVDMGLKISNPESFTKINKEQKPEPPIKVVEKTNPAQHQTVPKAEKEKKYDYKKLKSYEWILKNSQIKEDLKKNLKNVEIKDLNLFLTNARQATVNDLQDYFGSYRGRIIDINSNDYGSLLITMSPYSASDGMMIKGEIKIFKNEKESMSKNFNTNKIGYVVDGTGGFIIDNGDRFFQVYKINETQQLVGYFYERLVMGTTKTIGTFILNRTDRF